MWSEFILLLNALVSRAQDSNNDSDKENTRILYVGAVKPTGKAGSKPRKGSKNTPIYEACKRPYFRGNAAC